MRKLASIRKIKEINPIDGADAIESALVDGWKVVVKKNEFKVGDLAIYFEIDSWVPDNIAPFLSKGQEVKEFNGVKGNRLRTVKLRGQVSQGLLLPVHDDFTGTYIMVHPEDKPEFSVNVEEGDDVTEVLGVQKWEPPIPTQLAGEIKGALSSFIPVTDEERIQNLADEIKNSIAGQTFEKTIKLDGTSMTVFNHDSISGVAGRNWEYRETEANALWRVARKNKLLEAVTAYGKNIALRGELIGEGIQGNNENIKGLEFYLFNIWDIDNSTYVSPDVRNKMVDELNNLGANIKKVPSNGLVTFSKDVTVDDILAMADGESLFAQNREGVVFKRIDGKFSFKAISNWYLLKHTNR